jgi:hypothetical protein
LRMVRMAAAAAMAPLGAGCWGHRPHLPPGRAPSQESGLAYTLKVNIEDKTGHVGEGVALGLREERERHSDKLERLALFKGATQVSGQGGGCISAVAARRGPVGRAALGRRLPC